MDVDKIIWCLKNGRSESKDALKKMLSSVDTIVNEEINAHSPSNELKSSHRESKTFGAQAVNSNKLTCGSRMPFKNNDGRIELPRSNTSQSSSHENEAVRTQSQTNQRFINLNKSPMRTIPLQYENMPAVLSKENDSTLLDWPHSNKIQLSDHENRASGTQAGLTQRVINLNKSTGGSRMPLQFLSNHTINGGRIDFPHSNKIQLSDHENRASGTQAGLTQRVINLNKSTGGSRMPLQFLSNHTINGGRIDFAHQRDSHLNNNEAVNGSGCELMMQEMDAESNFGDVETGLEADLNANSENDWHVNLEADLEPNSEADLVAESEDDCEAKSEDDWKAESEDDWKAESEAGTETEINDKYFQLFKMKSSTKENLNFFDKKGYLYSRVNDKAKNSFYFRCKNNTKFQCRARVIAKSNDIEKCVFTDLHNHKPEDHSVDEMKFKLELDKNCVKHPFEKGRVVYSNKKLEMKDEVNRKSIRGKEKYGTRIYRHHRKSIPKLPSSTADFEESISEEEYNHFAKDHRGQPFYRGVWSDLKGDKNIVFISETILKFIFLLSAIKLRMDGTFKVLPCHILFRQLFIISVMYEDESYPLAYIFMEKKDFPSYDLIMKKLKEMLPKNVTHIMADYEAATRKAIKVNFPKARLCGCYFHYVQAIRKIAKRFGLKKDVRFTSAIRMLSALALLPSNFIAKGFEYIGRAFPKSQRWSRLIKYWKRQWQKANISVFNLIDRTNNYAESLNKYINLLVKIRKPDIWTLIHNIKLIDMDYADKIDRAYDGEMNTKKVNHKKELVIELEETMDKAMIKFKKDQDVGRFLRNVTYRRDPQNILKERVHLDNDITTSESEDEEDDDEIIANDIQTETILIIKNKKRKHENSEMPVSTKFMKLKRLQ